MSRRLVEAVVGATVAVLAGCSETFEPPLLSSDVGSEVRQTIVGIAAVEARPHHDRQFAILVSDLSESGVTFGEASFTSTRVRTAWADSDEQRFWWVGYPVSFDPLSPPPTESLYTRRFDGAGGDSLVAAASGASATLRKIGSGTFVYRDTHVVIEASETGVVADSLSPTRVAALSLDGTWMYSSSGDSTVTRTNRETGERHDTTLPGPVGHLWPGRHSNEFFVAPYSRSPEWRWNNGVLSDVPKLATTAGACREVKGRIVCEWQGSAYALDTLFWRWTRVGSWPLSPVFDLAGDAVGTRQEAPSRPGVLAVWNAQDNGGYREVFRHEVRGVFRGLSWSEQGDVVAVHTVNGVVVFADRVHKLDFTSIAWCLGPSPFLARVVHDRVEILNYVTGAEREVSLPKPSPGGLNEIVWRDDRIWLFSNDNPRSTITCISATDGRLLDEERVEGFVLHADDEDGSTLPTRLLVSRNQHLVVLDRQRRPVWARLRSVRSGTLLDDPLSIVTSYFHELRQEPYVYHR